MSHIPDIREKQTVKGVEARNIYFRTTEAKHNRFYSLAGHYKIRNTDFGIRRGLSITDRV